MKKQHSSLTAEGIAFLRATESEKPSQTRICYDPYAKYFVSPALGFIMRLFMNLGYTARRGPGVAEFLAIRCRYIDDYLQTCLEEGIQQLVILGAGFDSRAYRFEALKGQVQVFEVDHPATQQVKLERLRKIPGVPFQNVIYVPVDFETQTLEQGLFACGYNRLRKTLFIWEGVVYYLTPEAVDSTLAFIAHNSGPGSSIIFDYAYTSLIDGTAKRGEAEAMRRNARWTGEGMVFGIPEGDIQGFLEARGFEHVEDADSKRLTDLYLTGVNRGKSVPPTYAIVHATVKPRAN